MRRKHVKWLLILVGILAGIFLFVQLGSITTDTHTEDVIGNDPVARWKASETARDRYASIMNSGAADADGTPPPFKHQNPLYPPIDGKPRGSASNPVYAPAPGHLYTENIVTTDQIIQPNHPYTTTRRPCGEHIELNKHFVDRGFWQTIKPEEMAAKRNAWREFVDHRLPVITKNYERFGYHGRGLVYTASGRTLARALASIGVARLEGMKLPVQIWYMSDELKPEDLDRLEELDIEPKDILVEQRRFEEFKDFHVSHSYGASRNYHIKSLVLLLTEFEEVLYLDSDNLPLRDPEYLFNSKAYKDTGAIFWPDFWKIPIDNPIWQITGQHCEDEREQESGQLVLDKRRSLQPLLLSLFFQMDHAFYFRILLGDKDTFRFAWKILDRPYHFMQQPASIAGRMREGRFCGHTMIQHDTEGEILFAHTTAMKTTSSIREGNTWEAIQYLQRTKPVELAKPSENIHAFLVAYPQAQEYSGGADKPESSGGVGAEINPNPCLDYGIKNLTIETTSEAVGIWGHTAVDSFRIVTESFATYEGGKYRWFEPHYYKFGGPGSQSDRTCGGGRLGNGLCADPDACCSAWGHCGLTIDHCGVGCAGGSCFSTRRLPANPSPDFEYCGDGKIGFGVCKDPKSCCSKFGWCSRSEEFCKRDNCLSGPCATN